MPTTPSVPITAEQWAIISAYLSTITLSAQDLEDRIRALEQAQERDEVLIAALRIVFLMIVGYDLS